jgi:hypothetical protein
MPEKGRPDKGHLAMGRTGSADRDGKSNPAPTYTLGHAVMVLDPDYGRCRRRIGYQGAATAVIGNREAGLRIAAHQRQIGDNPLA